MAIKWLHLYMLSPHGLAAYICWTSLCAACFFIESVDSICRDSANMQYIKVSQNLKNENGKLVSLYDNLPFIFKCFMTYNAPRQYQTTDG